MDVQTPWLCKVLVLLTLAYALSPIDLIPDFIPVLGYLDDFFIIPALITLSIRCIPGSVMAAARQKALAQPVRLKSNPTFAVIFVSIWIVLAAALASALSGR